MVRFRCEMRAGFGVERPQAVTQDGVILHYEKALLRHARRCGGTGVKPVIRGLGRVCGSVGGMSQTSLPC